MSLSPRKSYFLSPTHSHVLCLRNLSQHFPSYQQKNLSKYDTVLRCSFCVEDIDCSSTSIYCCEKCRFYVHTSCARAPRQIQHPRHQHPLDLHVPDEILGDFNYLCVEFDRGCSFKLSARVAMKTLWVEKYYCSVLLREAGDGESRLQFAHEHPLTSFPARTEASCGGCKMQISEESYGCGECGFFLHKACADAPLGIQSHPSHPQHPLHLFYDSSNNYRCRACRSRYLMGYRCEECKLIFDLFWVISTMPCEDVNEREDMGRRQAVMDHPLHPHQLSSYHFKTQAKIECKICYSHIPSDDFLGCSCCRFFLHESCAQRPTESIQRYLHPEHALTYVPIPYEVGCLLCGAESFRHCYWYTCQKCDIFIHPTCASATLSELEKGAGMTVQCSFHGHELTLCCDYDAAYCTLCNGTIQGETPRYKCSSQECSFDLHISCVQKPHNSIHHPSHSLHPLTLAFKPPNEDIECRSCYTGIKDTFAFSCGEGECNFYLHQRCAQKPTLQHPFHDHILFHLNYTEQEVFECSACRKSCNVDFLRCAQCNFNLHCDCSQLPSTVKHERHCDPLVLRESFIEDDSGEYYCDICERRRDPNKWVYFCETPNCELVAHIQCALSSAQLEVIEEDDFIRRKEDIQRREEEIKLLQEQAGAEEAILRPLMAKVEAIRAKLESRRAELKEQKIEHAKWINMEVIEEDEPIKGEEDSDSSDDEPVTILEELEAI